MESSGASAALDRSAEAKRGKLVQLLTLIRGLFDLSWDGLGWASNVDLHIEGFHPNFPYHCHFIDIYASLGLLGQPRPLFHLFSSFRTN